MLCNICTKNQATVHLTEIVDDKMNELHLCDDCARKKSMQMEQQFGLSDLLAGLVDYGKQLSSVDKEATAVMHCSACGLTYEDFRKIGRLGCGECYAAFAKYLGPLLKRIHGANQHVGKAPKGISLSEVVYSKAPKTKAVDVNELKASLQRAIEREDFEEAALLRDAIKESEARMKEQQKKRAKQ
ncbi:MAG: UvrB/UvrC motif-containing protein [Candidatus Omnitrophota bacterium]